MLRDADGRARKALSRTQRAVHAEITQQMAAAHIPEVTGRLRGSLISAGHPDHVYRFNGTAIEFGSLDPAATFNPAAVPVLDAQPLFDILAEEYFVGSKGGGRPS